MAVGADVPRGLPTVINSFGALVESPQLFPSFSGRRNLQILAALASVPAARVDEMLELVGLADRADDRVKGCSLEPVPAGFLLITDTRALATLAVIAATGAVLGWITFRRRDVE